MTMRASVLFLWLVLSMHGPSEAKRVQVDVHSEEQAFELDEEADLSNWSMHDPTHFTCPEFLKRNETEMLCYYDGGFDHPDFAQEFPDPSVFEASESKMPILFDNHKNGGVFKLQSQFMSEMAAAMGSKGVLELVFKDVIDLEMERNVSFKEKMAHWKHKMHALGENVKPAEFLMVHAGLEVVFECVIMSMHGIEALAELALHGGLAIAEGSIEGALLSAVAIGAAELAAFIPIIGWALIVPMAIFDIYKAHKHYKKKTHHAKDFAKRLVLKCRCMENQVAVRQKMVSAGGHPATFLKPVVAEVCGVETADLIAIQMQRANFEMRRLFQKIEEIGRCLYPHGDRHRAKRNCAAAVYDPLREVHGKPGLFFEALMFAAAYAEQSDQISAVDHYGPWFRVEFGIDIEETTTFSTMIQELQAQDKEHRAVGCMSILATHRAFEKTFARLVKASTIWMKTFARDIAHTDITVATTRHPCKQTFYSAMGHEEGDEHENHEEDLMCKDEQFKVGHGEQERDMNEDRPCMAEVTIWPTPDVNAKP